MVNVLLFEECTLIRGRDTLAALSRYQTRPIKQCDNEQLDLSAIPTARDKIGQVFLTFIASRHSIELMLVLPATLRLVAAYVALPLAGIWARKNVMTPRVSLPMLMLGINTGSDTLQGYSSPGILHSLFLSTL